MKLFLFIASLLLVSSALFYENRREWTDDYDGLSKYGKIADLNLDESASIMASGGSSVEDALRRAQQKASYAGRVDEEIRFSNWLKAQKEKDRPVVYSLGGFSLLVLLVSIFKTSSSQQRS
jgi:hypothetical protein